MNTNKKLIALLLAIVMVVSQLTMVSVGATEDQPIDVWHEEYIDSGDYTYGFITEECIRIYWYYGEETDLVIPEEIDGYKVTEIYDEAFYENHTLESVTVPDGVEYIGYSAFACCENLASITLPESVIAVGCDAFFRTAYYYDLNNWEDDLLYVGNYLVASIYMSEDYEFEYDSEDWWGDDWIDLWSLESKETIDYKEPSGKVVIKDGTTVIADSALQGCYEIESVIVPDSVLHLGYNVFSYCESLRGVTLGNGIKSIPMNTFEECWNLTSVKLPENLEVIEDYAFYFSGLVEFEIPATVQYIGAQVFDGCPLENIFVADENENYADVDGVLFTKDLYTLIQYPIARNKSSYVVPDGVVEIGFCSFNSAEYLKAINMPDSVELISEYAFVGAVQLKSVIFGANIKEIGYNAFYWCESIQEITIPDTVTSIGDEAFSGCSSLLNITISQNINHIGYGAFDGTAAYRKKSNWDDTVLYIDNCLIIGYSIEESYDDFMSTVNNTKRSYTVKEGTRFIATAAFENCYLLKEIVLPSSLKIIDEYAFYSCKTLRNVYFGGTTKIGNYAFYDCWALEEVAIPETVQDIGFNAFGFYYDFENEVDDCQFEDFIIKGKTDSFAQMYAQMYGFVFEEVTEEDLTITTTTPTTTTVPSEQPITQTTNPTTVPTNEPISELTTVPTTVQVVPTVTAVSTTVACVHPFKLIKIANSKQATYFETGFTGDKFCGVCGEILAIGEQTNLLKLATPTFKLASGKKQFKVKYTKVADATGFQVRYKIKGKWKIKTFNSKKSVTKAIKKLKKGTYQVQIRAMIKQNNQTAYSAWSKTKKVKVK